MIGRLTYIFSTIQDRPVGWTTNFWIEGSNLNGLLSQGLLLAPVLNNLQGNQTLVKGVRVSDDDPDTRLTKSATVDISYQNTPATKWASDYANTAVLVEFENSLGQKAKWPLRGIPIGLIETSGRLTRNFTSWNTNFANFALTASNYGLRMRVRDLSAPKVEVVSIGLDGQVYCPGHPFFQSDIVQLYGSTKPYSLAGTYRVLSTTNDSVTLAPWTALPGPVTWTSKVELQRVDYVFTGISEIHALRMSSRNCGRPLGSPRGRR